MILYTERIEDNTYEYPSYEHKHHLLLEESDFALTAEEVDSRFTIGERVHYLYIPRALFIRFVEEPHVFKGLKYRTTGMMGGQIWNAQIHITYTTKPKDALEKIFGVGRELVENRVPESLRHIKIQ